jgi:hypothetical protein
MRNTWKEARMKIRTNVRAGLTGSDRCGGTRCGGTRCGGTSWRRRILRRRGCVSHNQEFGRRLVGQMKRIMRKL